VDLTRLEDTLMAESVKKFADQQKALLALIADKRKTLGVGPAGDGSPQDPGASPVMTDQETG
jgi:hypothetical protein